MAYEHRAFDAYYRESAQWWPAEGEAEAEGEGDAGVDGDYFLAMGYPDDGDSADGPRSPIALPFACPPSPEPPGLPAAAAAAPAPRRGSGGRAAPRLLLPATPVTPLSNRGLEPPLQRPATVRETRDAFAADAPRDPTGVRPADSHLARRPGGARARLPLPDYAGPAGARPVGTFPPTAGEGPRNPRRASAASSSASSSSTAVGGVDAAAGDRRSLRNVGTVKRTMSMRGSRPRVAKVRVVSKTDSKSYFSVERTMYQWIYMSTVILGNSLTFYAVAHSDPAVVQLARSTATLLSGLSLVVVYYAAVYAFRRRRALDRQAAAAAFDDRAGPVAVVTMICSVFFVYVILATKSIVIHLHRTSFGPVQPAVR